MVELFSEEMRVVWGDEWAELSNSLAFRVLNDLAHMWVTEHWANRGANAMVLEYQSRIFKGNLDSYAHCL